LTQSPSGVPPSETHQYYEPAYFYYYFTSALTRAGDIAFPYNDNALRCAFARVAGTAKEMGLTNGSPIVYDFYRTWLLDAEKVKFPQDRHDSMLHIKQCTGHDEHDKEFEALAQMFKADVGVAIEAQNHNTQIIPLSKGRNSTRRTRRSPSTASTGKYSPPSQ